MHVHDTLHSAHVAVLACIKCIYEQLSFVEMADWEVDHLPFNSPNHSAFSEWTLPLKSSIGDSTEMGNYWWVGCWQGRLVGWIQMSVIWLHWAGLRHDRPFRLWMAERGGSQASSRLLYKLLKKLGEEDQLFREGSFTIFTERKKRVLSLRQVISSPDHRLGQIAPKCS